jgi:starvation-inducible outer membrane lipoprotein
VVRYTKENLRKREMKTTLIIAALLLTGCATNPDVQKSVSRDQTMDKMAKAALINEMLNSPDAHVRAKGAAIAEKFLTEPKKNLFGF